jgi:hypothetical protein
MENNKIENKNKVKIIKEIKLCKYINNGVKCARKASKNIDYCKWDERRVKTEIERKNGIFRCSSNYKCNVQVETDGIDCDECLAKDNETFKKRKISKLNDLDNHDGEQLCTSKPHWRPIAYFIDNNGKPTKRCKICRDVNNKAKKKQSST